MDHCPSLRVPLAQDHHTTPRLYAVLARAAGLTRVVGWPPRIDRVEAGITVRLAAAPQVACTNRETLIAGASAGRTVGWTCLRRSADLKTD
jgi:hypothetical protein